MAKKKAPTRKTKARSQAVSRSQTATRPRRKRQRRPETIERSATIRKETLDEESRSVEVSFSSETQEISFWGSPQVLLHEPKSVDLKPLRDVGAVLFNHNPDAIIGRAENVRIDEEGRVGRATIVFDDDEESTRIMRKVASGSARGISVRARVGEWQTLRSDKEKWTSPSGRTFKGPMDIATKWSVREISVTPVPADSSVGVGRMTEDDSMNQVLFALLVKRGMDGSATEEEAFEFLREYLEKEPAFVEEVREADPTVIEEKPAPKAKKIQIKRSTPQVDAEAIRQEERKRHSEITRLCAMNDTTRAMAADLIASSMDLDACRKAILDKLTEEQPPTGSLRATTEMGAEEKDKFRDAATDWLLLRTGGMEESDPGKFEARRTAAAETGMYTLLDLARSCVERIGERTRGLSKPQLLQRAIGHGESDFANVLENVANKRLLAGYEQAPSTYEPLVTAESAVDFKLMSRPKLGDSGEPELTSDLAPMPEGSVPDSKESYQIATYAKRFGIGRQAIINDDVGVFSRFPAQMGAAARRKQNRLFWDLLVSASGVGPTMAEDSKALFAADHTSGDNYDSGSAAPITVANLGAAKAKFRAIKGFVDSNETAPILNLTPDFLVTTPENEVVAQQLLASTVDPAKSNSTPNPFSSGLTLIIEPLLSAYATTAWYLVASPARIQCALYAALDGNRAPQMLRMDGDNVLGVDWAVYTDVGVKFVDHRGWYQQKGV